MAVKRMQLDAGLRKCCKRQRRHLDTALSKVAFAPAVLLAMRETLSVYAAAYKPRATGTGDWVRGLTGGTNLAIMAADLASKELIAMRSSATECAARVRGGAAGSCRSGRDLVGIAETGSGKTLAFLLPAVVRS